MPSKSPFALVHHALARLNRAREQLAQAEDGLTKADDFNDRAFHRAAALRETTQRLVTAAQRLISIRSS
jgi:hypothetical protein